MHISTIPENLYEKLCKVDTPTVCNAIEVVHGKRGFNNFSKTTIHIADKSLPPLVGFARTAAIQGIHPPTRPPEEVRAIRMAYYKYMSEGRQPSICVIQDLDYPNCVGSFWGEINNYSHKALGIKGTLTDGLMRDLVFLAPGYQVIAGGIGPSHAFVHVVNYDTPVEIFGMKIAPNDLIHADRHGAVVIPDDVIPQLADAIDTLISSENIILDEVKKGPISYAAFEELWKKFEQART